MRTRILALALFALLAATTPAVAAQVHVPPLAIAGARSIPPPCHDCYRAIAATDDGAYTTFDADDQQAIDDAIALVTDREGCVEIEVEVSYIP